MPTYATVSGKVLIPGTTQGIRARVTATPQTRDQVIAFPADDMMSWGPVVSYSKASDGTLEPMLIPISGDAVGVVWKFTVEPLDKRDGASIKAWSRLYEITADARLEDLVETEALTVSPSVYQSVSDFADAAGASASSAAAAATTAAASASSAAASVDAAAAITGLTGADDATAMLVEDPESLTSAALSATVASHPDVTSKVAQGSLFVSVKDHGAVGDGVTDDTAAIQAAITAANWPTTRATVFFPPGEYKVTSTISINGGGALSTPNLDLVGWGAKLVTTTAGITMIDITNSVVSLTRVRLRGFQIYVNAASTAVRLNNAQFVILDEIDFLGNFGLAVKIEGTSTYATISSCTFSNLARGIHIPGNAQYVNITGCHFGEQTAGSPLNWIQVDTVQTPNGSITGCTFYGEGNTLPAVNLVQGIGWTITGNKFAYCSNTALWIGRDGVSYGHTVTGNVFQSNGRDDIVVDGGKLNTITGNYFGTRKAGTAASTYCNVTILNTTGGTAGSDNTVAGNTSKDTGTALLASFSAHASCQNVAFVGNQYAIAAVNANTSALIVGRDGIQIPTGKDITRNGYSMPGVLARVTSIDAKVAAATTLYTVPTGKTAIITGAVVQSGAVSAITAGPTLGIGIAAGEDDIYAPVALTGLTSNAKTYVFPPPGLQASAPAGSVVKVGIDAASTGTSQLVTVSLLGFLI